MELNVHGWTGGKIYHDDDEAKSVSENIKILNTSFRDHSLFLKERKRYSKLFNLEKMIIKLGQKDLRAAGYATDRKYPQKLISLIERYQLISF